MPRSFLLEGEASWKKKVGFGYLGIAVEGRVILLCFHLRVHRCNSAYELVSSEKKATHSLGAF